jgi:hypothetical protein
MPVIPIAVARQLVESSDPMADLAIVVQFKPRDDRRLAAAFVRTAAHELFSPILTRGTSTHTAICKGSTLYAVIKRASFTLIRDFGRFVDMRPGLGTISAVAKFRGEHENTESLLDALGERILRVSGGGFESSIVVDNPRPMPQTLNADELLSQAALSADQRYSMQVDEAIAQCLSLFIDARALPIEGAWPPYLLPAMERQREDLAALPFTTADGMLRVRLGLEFLDELLRLVRTPRTLPAQDDTGLVALGMHPAYPQPMIGLLDGTKVRSLHDGSLFTVKDDTAMNLHYVDEDEAD